MRLRKIKRQKAMIKRQKGRYSAGGRNLHFCLLISLLYANVLALIYVRKYEAPLMSTMQPVRKSVPSEDKNRTVRATSSGWATRRSGL